MIPKRPADTGQRPENRGVECRRGEEIEIGEGRGWKAEDRGGTRHMNHRESKKNITTAER